MAEYEHEPNLVVIAQMIAGYAVDWNMADAILKCIVMNYELSRPIVEMLSRMFIRSEHFQQCIASEAYVAATNGETGSDRSIERSMIMGVMLGMMMMLANAEVTEREAVIQ